MAMARRAGTLALPLLHVHSNYSFAEGVDHPQTLALAAAEAGYAAVALTDRCSLSGGVRFVRAAQEAGIRPLLGAEVHTAGEEPDRLLLLAEGEEGYRNLSRLLTEANRLGGRRDPRVTPQLVARYAAGVFALFGTRRSLVARAVLAGDLEGARRILAPYRDIFGAAHSALVLERACLPGESRLEAGLDRLARLFDLPLVAAPPVRHARRQDMWLCDLLACVRGGHDLDVPSPLRPLNAEGAIVPVEEFERRYADRPDALAAAAALGERLRPPYALPPPRLRAPHAVLPAGVSAAEALRAQVREGTLRRYGTRPPAGLRERLEHELGVILDLGYAEYFLLVLDVVAFARRSGIRVAGRGSAADSAVAYVLGITEVDAFARGLLFERFMSRERGERPDIDLDFDARQRGRVAAYVGERYGTERVAAVGTFSTYRIRSAVRELGGALGFGAEELDRLAKAVPDVAADAILPDWGRFPELRGQEGEQRRYAMLWRAAAALAGAPRFPSTHLGGLVIADEPVAAIAPLFPAANGGTTMALDKDDVEDMGLIKLDLLSLRALSALDRTVRVLAPGAEARVRPDDAATYARIRRGETIGVFQLESPAQRSLQARLGAEHLEDLVHSVALIRPGPIQGNMVDPYVRRRRGEEKVSYLHPLLEPILAKTYGVVLFQEQVIEIAVRVAGFTPGEADRLRRVMTHGRSRTEMAAIGEHFVARARSRGVDASTAASIFEMLAGYASYGFSEAHAAAFGQTAYTTAFLLEHEAAASFAALLSEQPMGYYPPWVLATEAKRRGIAFLPPDVNRSEVACTVEEGRIRLGLALVADVGEERAARVVARRPLGGYRSLGDVRVRTGLDRNSLEQLVRSGAFDALSPSRRRMLAECSLPLGQTRLGGAGLDEVLTEDFDEAERRQMEVEVLGMEWRPSAWLPLRPALRRAGFVSSAEVAAMAGGRRVRVVGWPLRPHRPPTRSGRPAAFFSLVDEAGLADCVVFARAYERYGGILFRRPLPPLVAEGRVEVRGEGREVIVDRVYPWTGAGWAEGDGGGRVRGQGMPTPAFVAARRNGPPAGGR
jgi:error-prone DNA polymerase